MSIKVPCKMCGKKFENKEFVKYRDVNRVVYSDYCKSCQLDKLYKKYFGKLSEKSDESE